MKLIVDGIIEVLQNGGGCTVYFDKILKHYQENGRTLEFIRYANSNKTISIDEAKNKVIHQPVRVQERWRDVDTSGLTSDSVFHSTHYRLPKNRNKHHIITTVHDFTYELYRKGPAQWMHSWQKNRAIINSDSIICVSNNTAEDMLRFCPVDEKKIHVIHNGVSSIYHPLDNVEKTNSVVFVGARGWYKNFSLAVETLANHPDLFLCIVGGGALQDDEVKLLNQKIPGRYKHMGRLSDSELNELYNRAHCLLYPSSYEGFGIPVIEAMRAGCPVIAVNASSIPEVAGDAAILVDKAEVRLLDDALNQLKSHSTYKQLIQSGYAQAQKFSWQKCYTETLELYKKSI